VLDTLRGLRTSALVWIVAGGIAMYGMTMAIATEMADFPGGPKALAASITPSAEAMRILRWPAERLDTVGGYATYHNVIVFNLMLAIYAAVQGAKAVRGGEERHALEEVLATGTSRLAVIRDRALGFALAMGAIVLGLGVGLAAAMAGGGEGDLLGSLVTLAASGLAAMVGYGLGLLCAQLTSHARTASGVSATVVTALYVATNLGDELGPFAVVQYLSPFTYANHSRALVPGHSGNLPADLILVAMAAGLVGLAAWAFVRRDYAAAVWARRPTAGAPIDTGRIPTALLGSVWTATLRRGRVGLLAWALGAALLTALMASLEPAVMDVWSAFDVIGAMAGAGPGVSVETMYWSFTGALVSPVVAAYVIVQASGWVADLAQGRVELLLAGPVTWSRLVAGRLAAVVTGVLVITAAALGALAVVATAIGAPPNAAGLGRLAVTCVLFGAALAAIGAILVAWLRRGAAVTVLAVVVGASYLVAYLTPLFEWPDWINTLSVFWAFGQPYLEWPTTARFAVLLGLALPGAVASLAIAERTPKVA